MGSLGVVVLIVGFVGYSLSAPSFNSRPIIKTEEGKQEIIINSQTNVTLLCEGKEKIRWTYPNNTIEGLYWSTVIVETSESNGKFYAKLILTNASYVDVDYYYCHADDAPKDDEFRSTKIYVYIRDPVYLSVKPVDPIVFLNVFQYDTVVLPCRPTSPDVTVTLEDTNNNEVNSMAYSNHEGFKVPMNQFDQTFTCIFKRDGHRSELFIIVIVLKETEYVPTPYIDAPNNGRTKIGDSYKINCSVTVDANVYLTLDWIVPDQAAVASGRINYTKTKSSEANGNRLGFTTMTIKKVQENDAGEYICTITDHTQKKQNATKTIFVYKEGQSNLILKEESQMSIINTTGSNSFIQPLVSSVNLTEIRPKQLNRCVTKGSSSFIEHENDLGLQRQKLKLQIEYLKLQNYKTKLEILQKEKELGFKNRSKFTVRIKDGKGRFNNDENIYMLNENEEKVGEDCRELNILD